MSPRAVATGDEALALLSAGEPFDVVVLDAHMPDVDASRPRRRSGSCVPRRRSLSSDHVARPRPDEATSARIEFAGFLTKP